uniref:Uncharacterized protein n=1 Tax=Brassica oleracea var. oleracea TaxID=109376 RepID=A0A0D3ANZ8_BRAOL
MVLEGLVSLHSKNVQRLFVSWRIDAPRFVDPAQDDATMVETDVSPTKDKPGWIIDEHTDLKPAEVRVDELSDTTLELDELSDITLELSELSDTEDGAGIAAGRNEHFSAQRKVKMFGLLKKSSNKNCQQQAISKSSLLNTFDEVVTVQERPTLRRPHKMPNKRCKEQFKTSRDEAVQRSLFSQFEVQEFCDNLVEGVVKALKDVSNSHKKSTTTRAPVVEPSLFISETPKGKFENNLEDLKEFSDSLPIYDEYDDLMESLIICEDECDLPSPKPDLMFDIDNEETNGLTCFEPEHPSSLVLVSQVFEEEPLDYPQQGPRLDTRRPLDDDLGPIFDEEDELGPNFDEKAPSLTSINMENHLCFDPDTTPAPLSPNPQKHSEVRVDELSDTTLELDEVSDITLELSELSDTEDGAGLAAGRNEPFSSQRKVHRKFNMGTLNDINVLDRSPVLDDIIKGQAPQVTCSVNEKEYHMAYYLTDGIYPKWATFIQSIPIPQGPKAVLFAQRQEAVRKDVERALGVLQARFAIVKNPALFGIKSKFGRL